MTATDYRMEGGVRSFALATIAQSGTTTEAIDIGNATQIGLIMPSGWDAATIGFTVCDTIDGTYRTLYNEAGTAIALTVAVDKAYSLNTSGVSLAPWRYIKAVASAAQTTAARVLKFALK